MRKALLIIAISSFAFSSCKKDKSSTTNTTVIYDNDNPKVLTHIAFGSCFLQSLFTTYYPQTIFNVIDQKSPELYLALGDNIYSDDYTGNNHNSDWAAYLTKKYAELGDSPTFQNFRAKYSIIATWDDHDFGMNNAAGDFVNKAISKDVFFNFWNLPKSGKRWERNGIYDSYYFGDADHKLQIIVLDMRWDLSNPGPEPISVITDQSKKMMSDEQWNWLKEELKKPAKVRIICSSTQFATEHNGYEAWANFPHEQERMYQTIKDAQAEGVFFLSGDVHMAEVNKRQPSGMYPIYDFTASGLHQFHGTNEKPSQYRIGQAFDEDNFGTIDIDWSQTSPNVTFKAFSKTGTPLITQTVSMNELKF